MGYFFCLCTLYRSIDDACLDSIAKFCPDMEQLDILGTSGVSPEGVKRYVNLHTHRVYITLWGMVNVSPEKPVCNF